MLWQVIATLFVVSFLLNFVWEMWQIPFYIDMLSASHWQGVYRCSQATAGDGVIALTAYGLACIPMRTVYWLLKPTLVAVAIYLFAGAAITILFEYLAVEVLDRWQYSELMPRLPIVGTGILPLLQWIMIPPCVLYVSKIFIIGLNSK